MKLHYVDYGVLVNAQLTWKTNIERSPSWWWSEKDKEDFRICLGLPTDMRIRYVDIGTYKKLKLLAHDAPVHWLTLFKMIDIKYPLTDEILREMLEANAKAPYKHE